jgi:hypothetical protein
MPAAKAHREVVRRGRKRAVRARMPPTTALA